MFIIIIQYTRLIIQNINIKECKILKNITIFFAILCSAVFLFAEENNVQDTNKEKQSVRRGLFINIGGGYNYGYDVKVEQSFIAQNPSGLGSYRKTVRPNFVHDKGGIVGKASLGYEWKNHSLAISIQQNNVEYKSEKDFSDGKKAKMTIKSNDAMLGYYYKFNTNTNFIPYLGVSAGIGFTKTEFADFGTREYQVPVTGVNLGLQYNLNEKFSLVAEYSAITRGEKNNVANSSTIDNKVKASTSAIFGAYIKYYIW